MTTTAPLISPLRPPPSQRNGTGDNGSGEQRRRGRLKSALTGVVSFVRRVVAIILWVRRRFGETTFQRIRRSILLAYVVGLVWHHWRGGEIRIAPLSVPATLGSLGLSGHELTARLIDHVDSVRETARLSSGQTRWVVDTPVEHPNIEVPWLGIPLSEMFDLLDAVGFTHHSANVSWELTARGLSGQRVDEWILSASVADGRLHEVHFSPNHPDSALAEIADAILGDLDPYTAIRALSFTGRCDDARMLASQELAKAQNKEQLVIANNVMGFASECGFVATTAGKTAINPDAAYYYQKAIDIDPRHAQAHASLAKLLADTGGTAGEKEFAVAARLDPKSASTYEAWGYALMLSYNYDAAIEKLRLATQLDAHSAAYNNLGFAYLNKSDTTSAMANFELGAQRHAEVPALKAYGHLLLARGRLQSAADVFRRASRLAPGDAESRYWLGIALDSAAQKDAARTAFSDAARVAKDGDFYCAAARQHLPQKARCAPGH